MKFMASRDGTYWFSPGPVAVALWLAAGCATGNQWQKLDVDAASAADAGRYADAERLFLAALKETEAFGPEDSRMGNTLHNLAWVYLEQGKVIEAEPVARRAITILEKFKDRQPQNYANAVHNLGTIYLAQGRYGDAEPLLGQAVTLNEGGGGVPLARALHDLGSAYARDAKYTEAQTALLRSLDIAERARALKGGRLPGH